MPEAGHLNAQWLHFGRLKYPDSEEDEEGTTEEEIAPNGAGKWVQESHHR
jgi:hypothetical protein